MQSCLPMDLFLQQDTRSRNNPHVETAKISTFLMKMSGIISMYKYLKCGNQSVHKNIRQHTAATPQMLCVSVILNTDALQKKSLWKHNSKANIAFLRSRTEAAAICPAAHRELCNASEPSEIINQLSESVHDTQNNSDKNDNRKPLKTSLPRRRDPQPPASASTAFRVNARRYEPPAARLQSSLPDAEERSGAG